MKRLMTLAALLALSCGAGAVGAEARREIRFPDLPGYQTLKCDFHEHTVFSDGLVWPTVRVEEAWREGLDAIALTDHIEYQPHKQDLPTNHNRPYELAAELAKERNILLIRGAEITRDTPPGHFNAIFLTDINALDTPEFYDVFDQASKQNAFVFWNHPGWQGPERGRWGPEQTTLFEKKQLHGIEVCNGDSYYPEAHQWAIEKNLTLMGDSDIHHPSPTTEFTAENHRTLTLVFARERTLDAIREALDAGRTAIWFQNQVIGRKEQLAPMFEACVHVHTPHFRSKDRVWLEIENGCELDIKLDRSGKSGPATIKLPARATSLVRLNREALEGAEGLTYSAVNFVIGPDQPLPVKLEVPTLPAEAHGSDQQSAAGS
jgi:predicted metal-dependent phosphoesterase TrpH